MSSGKEQGAEQVHFYGKVFGAWWFTINWDCVCKFTSQRISAISLFKDNLIYVSVMNILSNIQY